MSFGASPGLFALPRQPPREPLGSRRSRPGRSPSLALLVLQAATVLAAVVLFAAQSASAAGVHPALFASDAFDAPLPGVASATFSVFSVALTDATTQRFEWAQIDVALARPLSILPATADNNTSSAAEAKPDPFSLFRMIKGDNEDGDTDFPADASDSHYSQHDFFSSTPHPLNKLLSLSCPPSTGITAAQLHNADAHETRSSADSSSSSGSGSDSSATTPATSPAASATSGLARVPVSDDLESLFLSGVPTVMPAAPTPAEAAAAAARAARSGAGAGGVLSLLQGRRRAAQPLVTLVSHLSSSANSASAAADAAATQPNFPSAASSGAGISALRVHVLLSAPASLAPARAPLSAEALALCTLTLAPRAHGPWPVDAASLAPVSGAIPLVPALQPSPAVASVATGSANSHGDAAAAENEDAAESAALAAEAVSDAALAQALTGGIRALRRQQRLRAAQVAAQRQQQALLQRAEGRPGAPAGPDDFSIFLQTGERTARAQTAATTSADAAGSSFVSASASASAANGRASSGNKVESAVPLAGATLLTPAAAAAASASAHSSATRGLKALGYADVPLPASARNRRIDAKNTMLASFHSKLAPTADPNAAQAAAAAATGAAAGAAKGRRGAVDSGVAEIDSLFDSATPQQERVQSAAAEKLGRPVSSLTASLLAKMDAAPAAANTAANAASESSLIETEADAEAKAAAAAAAKAEAEAQAARDRAQAAAAAALQAAEDAEDADNETFEHASALAAVGQSEEDLGDLTTVFFETAAKVDAVLLMESRAGLQARATGGAGAGARARTQQILASIVDPICEMVPPVMGEVSMNALLPQVAKTIKAAIGDLTVDAMMPEDLNEMVGKITSQPERGADGQPQTKLLRFESAMKNLVKDDESDGGRQMQEKLAEEGQPDMVSSASTRMGVANGGAAGSFIETAEDSPTMKKLLAYGRRALAQVETEMAAEASAPRSSYGTSASFIESGSSAGYGEEPTPNSGEPQTVRGSIDMGVKTALANKLVAAFMTDTVPNAINLMHQSLSFNVDKIVNNTVTREASRSLTVSLTHSLIESLTHTSFRIFSQSLTRLVSQSLTRATIHSVSNAVAQTATRAMTRTPVADVFCELCRMGKDVYRQTPDKVAEFCDACWSAEAAGQQTEHYTGQYAKFYTTYYAWHYGGHYARLFADDYILGRSQSMTSIFPPVPNQRPAAAATTTPAG